jgi:uncharacterized protein (TIGR02246 family)
MIRAFDPAADQPSRAIAALRAALEAAENAGDAGAAAALLADDVVVMVPDFPVQEGKEACAALIRDVLPALVEEFDRRITYSSAEVLVTGDTAIDRGTFDVACVPRSGGRETRMTGKYLWLLRRASEGAHDAWSITRLIVSRDEARAEKPHLNLVALVVHDYDPAIRFFVDVLGFELVEDSPSLTNDGRAKRWVVVRLPDAETGLLLARADSDRQTAIVGNQHGGRVGFFLRVDDFGAYYERMTAAGVEFVSPPRVEPYGQVAVFVDIAGNRWDLVGPGAGGG